MSQWREEMFNFVCWMVPNLPKMGLKHQRLGDFEVFKVSTQSNYNCSSIDFMYRFSNADTHMCNILVNDDDFLFHVDCLLAYEPHNLRLAEKILLESNNKPSTGKFIIDNNSLKYLHKFSVPVEALNSDKAQEGLIQIFCVDFMNAYKYPQPQ